MRPLIGVLAPVGVVRVQLDDDLLPGVALIKDDGARISPSDEDWFDFVVRKILQQWSCCVGEDFSEVRFAGIKGLGIDAIVDLTSFSLSE